MPDTASMQNPVPASRMNFENRTLYHGDNLPVLQGMNSRSVQLIATDPPFNKNKDFHVTPDKMSAGVGFEDRWRWREDLHPDWLDSISTDEPEIWNVIMSAKEAHSNGMGAFLCWLGVRVLEMHRVLADGGSFYLHIDHTAHAWVKCMLDAVFGPDQFRNEIVWRRSVSHNDAKRFGAIHDTILYYVKGGDTTWNGSAIATPRTPEELRIAYPSQDERGRYRADNLTGPRHNAERGSPSTLPWKDYDVYAMNRVWSVPKTGTYAEYIEREFIPGYRGIAGVHERLDALDKAGLIHHPDRGKWPGLKRYAAADTGKLPQDLILEPRGFTNYSKKGEATGYPTQKPLALYERIIKASSNPGDMVLDPFVGCATTPVAAERLGRQWVGIDIWDGAYQMVLDRMEQENLVVPQSKKKRGQQTLTFADIHLKTVPPQRTDDGDPATVAFRTPTGKRPRHPKPRTQHPRLLADIGAFCQGCGRDYGFDPRVLEVDHIRPTSEGGSDAYDNLTLLCPPCNKEKKDHLTLTGLQARNRTNGHLPPEREPYLRHGRAQRTTRRRRRRR